MDTERKISKVGICNKCDAFVLAAHVDRLDKETEKEFTELTNNGGFTVKLETGQMTRDREYSPWKTCWGKTC